MSILLLAAVSFLENNKRRLSLTEPYIAGAMSTLNVRLGTKLKDCLDRPRRFQKKSFVERRGGELDSKGHPV